MLQLSSPEASFLSNGPERQHQAVKEVGRHTRLLCQLVLRGRLILPRDARVYSGFIIHKTIRVSTHRHAIAAAKQETKDYYQQTIMVKMKNGVLYFLCFLIVKVILYTVYNTV